MRNGFQTHREARLEAARQPTNERSFRASSGPSTTGPNGRIFRPDSAPKARCIVGFNGGSTKGARWSRPTAAIANLKTVPKMDVPSAATYSIGPWNVPSAGSRTCDVCAFAGRSPQSSFKSLFISDALFCHSKRFWDSFYCPESLTSAPRPCSETYLTMNGSIRVDSDTQSNIFLRTAFREPNRPGFRL